MNIKQLVYATRTPNQAHHVPKRRLADIIIEG